MQPQHARVPEDEGHEHEVGGVADDQREDRIEAADEDERDDHRGEDRHRERVAHHHRAREVPGLAVEHKAAHRAGRVHRDESPPYATGETARAAQREDRHQAAHQKYPSTTAATMIDTAAPTIRMSGT